MLLTPAERVSWRFRLTARLSTRAADRCGSRPIRDAYTGPRTFRDGVFRLLRRGGDPELVLSGPPAGCPDGGSRDVGAAALVGGRRLQGQGTGRFGIRTPQRDDRAGAWWLIEDRCDDSTVTRIRARDGASSRSRHRADRHSPRRRPVRGQTVVELAFVSPGRADVRDCGLPGRILVPHRKRTRACTQRCALQTSGGRTCDASASAGGPILTCQPGDDQVGDECVLSDSRVASGSLRVVVQGRAPRGGHRRAACTRGRKSMRLEWRASIEAVGPVRPRDPLPSLGTHARVSVGQR